MNKSQTYDRLIKIGFSFDGCQKLIRISKTLRRWYENECNGVIQREELLDSNGWDTGTGIPRKYVGSVYYKIADREKGALKRLESIMKNHVGYVPYVQTDPRGCALYIVPKGEGEYYLGIPVF